MVKCEKILLDGVLTLKFAGHLVEFTLLPEVESSIAKEVRLDLKGVQNVNSSGIQAWVKWIANLPQNALYQFENLPVQFVYHLSSVTGMLPKQSDLLSFMVPYFNPVTSDVELICFEKNKQFNEKNLSLPLRVSASENSKQILELDADPRRYFIFLKRFFPNIVFEAF